MKTKFKINQRVWFWSELNPVYEPVKTKVTGIYYGYDNIEFPEGNPYAWYYVQCGGSGLAESDLFKTKKECINHNKKLL